MEVTERTAEAMQRIDQHHVLISRVDEKLDTVVGMLKRHGTQNFEISTPVQSPPGIMQPSIMETHTPVQAHRSPHFEQIDERPIPAIPIPRFFGQPRTSAPSSPPMMSLSYEGNQEGYRQREWRSEVINRPAVREPPQSMWGRGSPIMTSQNFKGLSET